MRTRSLCADRYVGVGTAFSAIGGVGAGIGLLSSGLLQAVSVGSAYMPVVRAVTSVEQSNRDGVQLLARVPHTRPQDLSAWEGFFQRVDQAGAYVIPNDRSIRRALIHSLASFFEHHPSHARAGMVLVWLVRATAPHLRT